MQVRGVPVRTIRIADDFVEVIDQRRLPHELVFVRLQALDDAATAIRDMWVRGAPLIGVTAAAGMWLGVRRDASDAGVAGAAETLLATRPTAVNLKWAVDEMRNVLLDLPPGSRPAAARTAAAALAEEDVAACHALGQHGLRLLRETSRRPVQVMTRCNAGWLAAVDWGTALAPVYLAHDAGIPVHVWVPETRPRNQGMLTAWELGEHGVAHTVVADGAAGHLLQRGRVDVCIVGADRVTRRGDVCNKIGTYMQALAAREAGVPFYAAVPGSTIDWDLDGPEGIPIEEREGDELTHISGRLGDQTVRVALAPAASRAVNFAFDVTPARLVTGLITERGACAASLEGLRSLYPEHARVKHLWRAEIIAFGQRMNATGLNVGTSGNISVRAGGDVLITPSGLPYEEMRPADVVEIDRRGQPHGPRRPSSEWPMHQAILAARPEVGAILHAHSPFATALACLRRDIPAFHYMIAVAGGDSIRCAPYATFGTPELAAHAVEALLGRQACLLANHGMIAVGASLSDAFYLAREVENLAAQYHRALQIGQPVILEAAEMARVLEKFKTYGQRRV